MVTKWLQNENLINFSSKLFEKWLQWLQNDFFPPILLELSVIECNHFIF